MTPAQALSHLQKEFGAAYLLLGAEAYQRGRVKEAIVAAVLGTEGREYGLTQYSLAETPLAAVLDDARSLSLFAPERVIVVRDAEAALPRGRAAEEESEDPGPPAGGEEALAAYLRDPSPGVALVFEAVRFDFEGEDKPKLERVRKFYAAVPQVVELRRFDTAEARRETQALARQAGLTLEPAALELLLEALAAEVTRIAVEIEKLALYAGSQRPVTAEDVAAMAPDARSTTIFALVAALGRRDRRRALEILDTLCRAGEYLPLALAFLSTQFRMALVAAEAGLRSPQQIQGHFARLGSPVWTSRAEQIHQTVSRFTTQQIQRAVKLIFEADKSLRSARPDDRIVMEQFLLALTDPRA